MVDLTNLHVNFCPFCILNIPTFAHIFMDELTLDGPGFDLKSLDGPGFNSTSFALLSIMNNKYSEDVRCH